MNIDDFLDKEVSSFEGKAKILAATSIEAKQDEEMDIFKQVQLVRDNLNKKKLSEAASEFNLLRERYVVMTKKQALQNRVLFNELIKLNNEIIVNMELNAQETIKKVNTIKQLLLSGTVCLNKNLLDQANRLYFEIKGIYDQIPDIFFEEKRKIYGEILSFYILLSKYIDASAGQEFTLKRAALMTSIKVAKLHLGSGNEELVKADFEKISEMYELLPNGFQKEKAFLHNEILNLFNYAYLNSHTQHNSIQGMQSSSLNAEVNPSSLSSPAIPSSASLTSPAQVPASVNKSSSSISQPILVSATNPLAKASPFSGISNYLNSQPQINSSNPQMQKQTQPAANTPSKQIQQNILQNSLPPQSQTQKPHTEASVAQTPAQKK